ncbi:MAG TPA: hypothetical protein VFL91_05590 [Thermomicrobiales bacterium]|nr:hypothetical protein [Thermomicrobiales bacterium]
MDPRDETITVLRPASAVYVEHGVFGRGAGETAATLAGFAIVVDAVFAVD